MSKRNGPQARANPMDENRPSGAVRSTNTTTTTTNAMRYSRAEYAKVLALQDEVARADGDYQRLRNAYLEIAQTDPTHEVALAMIGHDMDRAHSRLQALIGLPRLPFTHEPSTVMRREVRRLSDDQH